jgi:hypothetical protein
MIIYGPSGVKFEARRFTGQEIQDIADTIEEGQSMSDHAMCQLLSSCWVRTIDQGPYSFGDAKPNFYNQVLKSDIAGLLLTLRVGSFRNGSEYRFAVRCPDGDCKARVPWFTNLSEHVLPRTRPLSPAGALYMQDGTPISIAFPVDEWSPMLPSGQPILTIEMRLMTLAAEEPMRKYLKQELKRKQRKTKDILLADRLASQIVGVNGEPMASIAAKLQLTRSLPQDDLYYLRDEIDMHECEVDALITVKCPECNWEFDAPLPFGPSFLDPTSQSRRDRMFGALPEPGTTA